MAQVSSLVVHISLNSFSQSLLLHIPCQPDQALEELSAALCFAHCPLSAYGSPLFSSSGAFAANTVVLQEFQKQPPYLSLR